ncbi:MAG: GntR family transcriptional regulator [Arhodomonas sp.]|nr:GntR family transcriptional regulator [Arhodomonas sp.]
MTRQHRRLPGEVASVLEREIRGGDHPAGTRLPTEAALAGRFAISRAAVREAIAELRRAGLVTTHQGRGTFVAEQLPERPVFSLSSDTLDLEELRHVYEIRREVEAGAAALAASNAGAEDLSAMRVAVEALERSVHEDRPAPTTTSLSTRPSPMPPATASSPSSFVFLCPRGRVHHHRTHQHRPGLGALADRAGRASRRARRHRRRRAGGGTGGHARPSHQCHAPARPRPHRHRGGHRMTTPDDPRPRPPVAATGAAAAGRRLRHPRPLVRAQAEYPYQAERSYTPDASEADYRHLLTTLGFQRAVLVQPQCLRHGQPADAGYPGRERPG